MHRETVLTPTDLIWPLFVTEGIGVEEPIAALPGVSRWSVDRIADRAAVQRGLNVLSEKVTPSGQYDAKAREVLFGAAQYQRRG